MTNENCLEGVKCPDCGNEDRFFIAANVMVDVTDSGADVEGDMEWDEKSFTRCPQCGMTGELRDFEERKAA
jgi:predicted RNA-binding Zn-ribbon protein involved in translation (DUF1610 family)